MSRVSRTVREEGPTGLRASSVSSVEVHRATNDMVTVQQAGLMYWQSATHRHLLPTYQAIPCQWHHTVAAATAAAPTPPAPPPPPIAPPIAVPLPTPPQAVSYLSSATRHRHHQPSPERQVATVEPEQPIGYGSFGVVW